MFCAIASVLRSRGTRQLHYIIRRSARDASVVFQTFDKLIRFKRRAEGRGRALGSFDAALDCRNVDGLGPRVRRDLATVCGEERAPGRPTRRISSGTRSRTTASPRAYRGSRAASCAKAAQHDDAMSAAAVTRTKNIFIRPLPCAFPQRARPNSQRAGSANNAAAPKARGASAAASAETDCFCAP